MDISKLDISVFLLRLKNYSFYTNVTSFNDRHILCRWCRLWLFYRSQPTSVNIILISISYLWDSLQTWFEVSLTWFITNRVPAKADIHCSLTLEYSAFDLHKERAEWFWCESRSAMPTINQLRWLLLLAHYRIPCISLRIVIGRFITARCSYTVPYFTPWFDDTMAVAFRHTLIFHYAKFGYRSLHKDTACSTKKSPRPEGSIFLR